MPSFRVRDLTINVGDLYQHSSAAEPAACDSPTIACFNAASIHPPPKQRDAEPAACDAPTIVCFNAASIHPPPKQRDAEPAACDAPTIVCFNAASIHPPPKQRDFESAATGAHDIACFNAASIHPPEALQLIAAKSADGSTIACFNAASVHPSDILRAALPAAAGDDLAYLRSELRAALGRLESIEEADSSQAKPPLTLDEVEMLQQKLTDALTDLNTQAENLKKTAASAKA